MKIAKVDVQIRLREPNPNPIHDALQVLPGVGEAIVRITSSEGVTGSGSAYFGRISAGPEVLCRLIETQLKPLVLGEDLFGIRAIRDKLQREMEYQGIAGVAAFALSCIDIALWDLLGKTVGQPIARLLGQQRDRIPAYAMVGWLNYDLPRLQVVCEKAVKQGFTAVKIKVGSPTLVEDLVRIRAVRQVLGSDVRILVDANQVFDLREALERGSAYADEGCWWFEEPLPGDQLNELAELRNRLDIRIASGENNYQLHEFRHMMTANAVDIVQADLRRAGGVTSILEIANLAHAFNIPYASHGGGAVHLHLMAAIPNACYLETGLRSDRPEDRLVDGCLMVPTGPGFSLE